MTKDEIFDKIDDVYSEHDGGTIYLSDERTERLKEIIQQAINFIPCCTELKDKEVISFEDWVKREGYENKWTGFWKEAKSVNYWTVKNRYNTYRNNL
tara:strand:- start:345 stop:635 length:291 start_codon:yes stop_codon:yes gene_type:complete